LKGAFMKRPFIYLAAVVSSVVALMAPGAAQADPGVTVVIGATATLQARTLVTVPITVTCDPVGTFFAMSFVSIEQASGTAIASGSGSISTLTCDSTAHTYQVSVRANTSGPPFHGGPAVAFASVNVFGSLGGEGGSAGPQTISLRG
jgi:hypothetical protein